MMLIVACAAVVVDYMTKIAAGRLLTLRDSVPVCGGIIRLTLVHNTGGAFGVLRGSRWFFVAVSVVVVAGLVWYLVKRRPQAAALKIALGLILGGALGNVIDRVVRGYVVDFIDLRVWPVFNVADMCITVGAGLVILSILAHGGRGRIVTSAKGR